MITIVAGAQVPRDPKKRSRDGPFNDLVDRVRDLEARLAARRDIVDIAEDIAWSSGVSTVAMDRLCVALKALYSLES